MTHDLERFVAAQQGVYPGVVAELRAGRKTGHWMWFVFPQVAGLGMSEMSRLLRDRVARRGRARTSTTRCSGLGCASARPSCSRPQGRSAEDIFGGIDAVKLRSSMTLFHRAAPDEAVFREVLDRFFGGVADPATDERLGRPDDVR